MQHVIVWRNARQVAKLFSILWSPDGLQAHMGIQLGLNEVDTKNDCHKPSC